MRVLSVFALALAVGCGGSGGGTSTALAQLSGTVYEIDGQSADLGGVPVVLKETGEWAWTDASGSFNFDGLDGGTYTLDFMGDGEGAAWEGDEFADGDGDPKVDVPDGGHVECDVALEDGKVKDFSSDHEDGQHAMAKLHLTDAAEIAGYHVGGGIKIAASDEGTLFKVCVEGLHGGDVIEIFVHEESFGTATADDDGRACLVLENELSADALRELAGLRVDVYLSGTDLRLLVGEVPELMEHDGEDGEDDGDKPDEDGDDGEDGDDNCECDDGDEPGEGEDGEGDDKPDGSDGNDDGTAGDGEGDGSDEGEECDEPGDGEGDEPGDDGDGEGDGSGENGEGGEDGVK